MCFLFLYGRTHAFVRIILCLEMLFFQSITLFIVHTAHIMEIRDVTKHCRIRRTTDAIQYEDMLRHVSIPVRIGLQNI